MTFHTPAWIRAAWEALLRLAQRTLDALYHPAQDAYAWLVHVAVIAGLFVWGVSLWGTFYSWGNISFDFLDWGEVTGPRYALLRDAAERGILPLHAGNLTALRGVTDRYFSIADTPFSPQYLLLPYFETGQYLFYDTLLYYTLGFIGLVLLYRKYHLSPVVFAVLFLVFNFNGSIIAQLAVGHSIWTGHFLIPFFLLLVFHLVEREKTGWRWILALVVVMLAILGTGYFHLYLWCLMFLALLALFNWRLVKPVFWGGLFTGLASLWRLMPPSLALSGITQEYLGGFPSVTDMIDGMVVLRDPYRAIQAITDTFPLNAWETDYYIGLLGLAFLVGCGILLPLWRERSRTSFQVQILIASLVFAAFSIGEVFAQFIRVFTFPPFTGERATARMFIIPLAFVLALACIYLQRDISQRRLPAWVKILGLGLAGLLWHDLNQHLQAWRIRYLDAMVDLFPKMPFAEAQHTLANHPDPVYTNMLAGGAVLAGVVMVFLIGMFIKQMKEDQL
jgi:hypothetical protein